jgi:hypothetical protein
VQLAPRAALSALLCCLALLGVAAGSALGATRYAAPGAAGAEPCNPAPCSLVKAVNAAKDGDQVIVAPGQYLTATDLEVDTAIDLGSAPGSTRPVIGLVGATLYVENPAAVVHDLTAFLTEPAMAYTLILEAGTVERVFASGENGAAACSFESGLARDSVCFDGLNAFAGEPGLSTLTLRNVTALPMLVGAGPGSQMELDAVNVIARSLDPGDNDLEINSNTSAKTTATFRHSNYATVGTTLSAGDDFTYTAPGTGSNQTAAPLFANPAANDFRPLPGSPTIDAGLADGLLGPLGLGGEPRSLPRCIGGPPIPDIGAYEFVPTEPCPKPSNAIGFGKLKRLKAKGTATLAVNIPGPGTLALAGKGLRVRKARQVAGPGRASLLLAAKGKWKRALMRKGSVKLHAKITFVPNGGDPMTVVRKAKLVKKG